MSAEPFPAAAAAGSDPQATRTNLAGAGCLAAGSLVAGRYRILALAGVGGMGMVYRAHDEQLDVDVALKVLRPEVAADPGFRERFRKELLLARQVSHRNAVRIHDLGVSGDLLFLTMDYVPGRSLRALLEEDGPLGPRQAVAIARQLAAALAAAHAEGVVHRDLKPANVLVDAGGRAFVTDFGVARSMTTAGPTQLGVVVGTPDYLSPEQARGEPVDGRSDVYALGILLFEMLSGHLPFGGDSYAERLAQRIGGEARDLSDLGVAAPARLRAVVRRCLQRKPARRYQGAAELLADLDALPATSASASPSRRVGGVVGLVGLVDRRRRALFDGVAPGRRRILAVVAAVAGLAVVTLLVLAAWVLVRAAGWLPGSMAGAGAGRLASRSQSAAVPAVPAEVAAPGTLAAPATRASLATVAPRHVVAVLPLAERTGRTDLAWSSTGVADMLAAALAESPTLRVVDSVRLLRTVDDLKLPRGPLSGSELHQLAELVEADRVVTGTVLAAGGVLRIDLALVAADQPAPAVRSLHAEARNAAQIFRLVGELGERLRGQLEAGVPPATVPPPLTASSAAMAAYTDGLGRLARADSLGARPALERAVAADPAFTAAWVRLAGCYQSLGYAEKAQAAAARAAATPGAAAGRLGYEARAQLQELQGAPEAAQETLQQLIKSYPHDLEARLSLAEAYGQQGKLDEAVAALRQVDLSDPNHPRGWYLLSKYLIQQGKARQAIDDTLLHAMAVQKRLGSEQGRADVLNALGVGYQELGELDRAADSYRQAADLRRRIDDRRGYATSLKNLATLALVRGAYDEAGRDLEQALEILQALGDRAGVADLENAYGGLEEERGRYDRALEDYRRALQQRRDLGDRLALAESLGNVGFAYHLLGDYDNALVYWQQALVLNRATGDRAGVVTTTQSIGQLQLAQGKWTDALKSFLDTLAESRKLGLKAATAVSTGFLGRVAQYQGRYQAALASYRDALAMVRQLGDRRGEAEFTLYEAETLQEIGMGAAADQRLAQVEKWLHGGGSGGGGRGGGEAPAAGENAEQLAELQSLRGKGLLRAGDAAGALAAFRLAEAQAAASHSPVERLQARIGRALAAAAAGGAAGAAGVARASPAAAATAAAASAASGASGRWSELRDATAEVERLGHVPLLLWAEEGMAAAELAGGDAAAAEEVARRALRLADRGGAYGGAFRLHRLLSRALAARGAAAEAAAERQRAAQEAARVEAGLAPEQRQSFARLQEVRDLAGHG
jgi:eukaryotic-like serine/threonine-protein kinase